MRIFVFCVLAAAVGIGTIAAYMHLYGNAHIKKALSDLVGSRVEFTSVALNLDKAAASFQGFSVAGHIGFDKNVFDADTFTVTFNKEKLEKEKRLTFDSIYVKGAKLNIIRDSQGILNIALPAIKTSSAGKPALSLESVADAAEVPSPNSFYDILKGINNIKIEDSSVTFEDRFRMPQPYKIWCDRLSADITSRDSGSGYLSTVVAINLRIPQRQGGDGFAGTKASMAVYPGRTDMELYAETSNVDLRIFAPYFQRNTPFSFHNGFFSSRTDLRMHSGQVDSLTTMYFKRLSLTINAQDPNAQFLNVSINRLAPYLKSGESIVFDFVMQGDARKPQFGVGPKVKFAVGMVAMEEVAKAIGQMQR